MKTVKSLTPAAYVFREVETLMAIGSLQSSAEVPLVAFLGIVQDEEAEVTALLFELCSKQTLSHYVGSAFLSEYVWLLLAMQVRFVAS